MKYIEEYFLEFWYLTSEMAPYLLLGFLFAGILHVYFKSSGITKYLGKNNFKSVVNASLFGIPLPLCSCGVIPTGVSLYRNGASKGSSLSFLISTPQTGVDSILVTYSLLGLPFAIVRPIVALITGVFGGFASTFGGKKEAINVENQLLETNNYDGKSKLYKILRYGFVDFLQDIVKWLSIGLLLAAFLSVIIPEDFFQDNIQSDFLGMLLLLLISVPLYVCATASVPIAAVLILKGLSPGAALVFLMAGPATNIATITVLKSVFGSKTLFWYLLTIFVGAIASGLIIDNFLPREWFTQALSMGNGMEHENHLLPKWVMYGSSIVLLSLLLNGLYLRYFRKYFRKQEQEIALNSNTDMEKIIIVNGMDCNHCKMNVEKNIKNISGVDFVEVDLQTSKVKISGDNVDLENIKSTVEGLGYQYSGEAT
jgi:uncharacterized protein